MNNFDEIEEKWNQVKEKASGKWNQILFELGVDEVILNGRNQPCPGCKGTDRFQYTNKSDKAQYFCRGCGSGDAVKLLQMVKGWSFLECVNRVEDVVGRSFIATSTVAPQKRSLIKLAHATWEQGLPVKGTPAEEYFKFRGVALDEYPSSIRFHPRLGYWAKAQGQKKSVLVSEHPAVIAQIIDREQKFVALYRLYLTQNGRKAELGNVKKVLGEIPPGSCIRFGDVSDVLSVGEGFETSLAILAEYGGSVCCAINANNLESLFVPAAVREVFIFGDNDENFTGQRAAYTLGNRLVLQERRKASVLIASRIGQDFADLRKEKLRRIAA